uniref:Lipase n=1 Tax=Globisporangium ultimum (strain ATCC 200006 / CBS 805.95 / DAOM BR144) TaxID=431595 RepID=K3WUT6_GLOUD
MAQSLFLLSRVAVALLLCAVVLLASDAHGAQEEYESVGIDADAGLTVMELVAKRGYAVEEHKVTTSDRYVLTMYRLPKSYDETQRNVSAAPNKPAVYLIHGLLDSSYTYVLNFRAQSLAYILADAGYDVWLGNNRGTTWSREHLDYTTKDDVYWDFSWEEMAKYDMPAMINYVLNTSKRPTLSYIGHSEGTMQAFAGFSINQELAQRVSYFGALAPVAFVGDTSSPVFIALAKTYLDKIFELLGVDEFFGKTPILQDIIGRYGCAFVDVACDSIINALTGPSENVNKTRIHVYISQTPAGTSVKNMGHFAQGIRDNTFSYYDYGCKCATFLPISMCPTAICKNKQVYKAFTPPAFDLSKMKYPRVAFVTGDHDWLATSRDIAKLRVRLPTGTIISETKVAYNHLDFTWAFDAADKVYANMTTQIKLFEGIGYN